MTFTAALTRIFNPLVRTMIARGMTFPDLTDLLKRVFVERAEADFGLDGKRMTDSRISLLTGLQRRDVRAHRTDDAASSTVAESAGPLPRVLARWQSDPSWRTDDGTPQVLTRIGDGLSFEALVGSVSRDMHSRTLLDELVRLGIVEIDGEDRVTLLSSSYVPESDAAMLGYIGNNLGDHAEAATQNLQTAPDPAPFFERAVHYNQLSAQSLEALDALARRLQDDAMVALNAEANRLQRQDADDASARGRFRCGAFTYVEPGEAK